MANAALRAPLVKMMECQQPEERLQRVWLSVRARREVRRHGGFLRLDSRLVVAAAICTCVVIVAAWSLRLGWLHTASTPAWSNVPASIEPGQSSRNVDFGDGALVSVHAGAQLDVLEQSERSVVLALRRGLTQFDIRPGGARRWRIECGAVTVEVVGTRFSIERSEASVRVAVERGRVLVRGAGVIDQVQSLEAGSSILVAATPAAEVRGSAPVADREAATVTIAARLPSTLRTGSPGLQTTAAPSGTQELSPAAESPGSVESRQPFEGDGIVRVTTQRDDVAELLARADAARLSGRPRDAVAPLQRIVGSHTQDPRAAMAAFTLGRLLLEGLGQPMQAAFAFERALALKLPAALEEDALARLVESHAKSGAAAQARTTAASYRARYPVGRRLADVNRWSPGE